MHAHGFASSTEHLLAEVARIELLLETDALARKTQRHALSAEERIHALLDHPSRDAKNPSPATLAARAEAERMAASIAARKKESAKHGVPLRLVLLEERFGLERKDVDLLLVALAPELPGRSISERTPLGFALEALHATQEARLGALLRLAPNAPLRRGSLIRPVGAAGAPLPACSMEIEPRILSFLLDDDTIDARLAPHVRVAQPSTSLEELLLPEDLKAGLFRAIQGKPEPVVTLIGPYGTGKRALVDALCTKRRMPVVLVDAGALLDAGDETFRSVMSLVLREGNLQGAAIHWAFGETPRERVEAAARSLLHAAADTAPKLTFFSAITPFRIDSASIDRPVLRVELPRPSAADQARLWASTLGQERDEDVDLAALASMFRLTGGQIRDTAAAARDRARLRDPEARLAMHDIKAACRDRYTGRMSALGRLLPERHTWDDLVLPPDRKTLLREICMHLRHRSRVHGEWGYGDKLANGKSLSALFSGPPGTGKTMAASVVARELGVAMFHVDLATVVSKYIGETEKHLAALFAEAEAASAALFFDEADALFAKRTEVRDAHDRYANLETSYLLQRIEAFEGVVILATNFQKNLDEAFLRRLSFVVEFPFPPVAERLRIWQGLWAPEAPRDPDVDLAFLAERIELSGGHLRNIALAAAFLAADEGAPIAMRHLLHATRREYQKLGKVLDMGALIYAR